MTDVLHSSVVRHLPGGRHRGRQECWRCGYVLHDDREWAEDYRRKWPVGLPVIVIVYPAGNSQSFAEGKLPQEWRLRAVECG